MKQLRWALRSLEPETVCRWPGLLSLEGLERAESFVHTVPGGHEGEQCSARRATLKGLPQHN